MRDPSVCAAESSGHFFMASASEYPTEEGLQLNWPIDEWQLLTPLRALRWTGTSFGYQIWLINTARSLWDNRRRIWAE